MEVMDTEEKALAKSEFISETWRYGIFDFAERFAVAGGDKLIRIFDKKTSVFE